MKIFIIGCIIGLIVGNVIGVILTSIMASSSRDTFERDLIEKMKGE